jgi:hypothetical protein
LLLFTKANSSIGERRKSSQRVGNKKRHMEHNFMLANGWGIVHDETGAHWVFIPLWDPPKFNQVGQAIFATLVIKQHLAGIANAKAKEMLTGIVKEQAKVVAAGFAKSMDDDGWCGTPYPHRIPGGGGPLGPDPENPVYKAALGDKFSANLNAKAAITLLGKTLNNAQISKAAEMI